MSGTKGRRVTLLDRYILSQLLWVFGFFSLILVSVYWVNWSVLLFDRLISDGQSLWVFLEFTALTLPMLIRTVLPISAFVAAVYVAVGLKRNNEIAVLQTAGLSPWRLARPVVVFGLIVAAFMTLLMHVMVPAANNQLAMRQSEIASNITRTLLREGVFQHPGRGITVYVAEITPEGALRGLYLSDTRSLDRRVDYTARSALIVPERGGPKLVMIEGSAQIYDTRSGRLAVTTFGDFTYDLGALIGPAGRRVTVQELPTSALLWPDPAQMAEWQVTAAQMRYELIARFIDGFTAVATALIGFAVVITGRFSRLGFWREVLVAVILIGLLQALVNTVAAQAMRSLALSWMGVLPVMLAVATGLTILGLGTRSRRVRAPAPVAGAMR